MRRALGSEVSFVLPRTVGRRTKIHASTGRVCTEKDADKLGHKQRSAGLQRGLAEKAQGP